jgi:hypothetical protein
MTTNLQASSLPQKTKVKIAKKKKSTSITTLHREAKTITGWDPQGRSKMRRRGREAAR